MATAMARGSRTIVMVLILIGLPMLLAAVEAVSYFRDNRNDGSIVSSGRGARVHPLCAEELRPGEAGAAGDQHARRKCLAGGATRYERVEHSRPTSTASSSRIPWDGASSLPGK